MTTFAFEVTLTESEYLMISHLLEKRIKEFEKKEDNIFNRCHISSIKDLEERIVNGRTLTSWNTFNPPVSDKVKEMLEYLEEVTTTKNKTEKNKNELQNNL